MLEKEEFEENNENDTHKKEQNERLKDYISKEKIRKEIEHYKFLQDKEYFSNLNRFTDQYFIYGDIIKILKRIIGE